MLLTDSFDGSAAAFEGDRTLEIRSLPANARVSKATVTLTPAAASGGVLFEETIVPGGDAKVSWGATKASGTGFLEVDFHQRRTLRAVQGSDVLGANLQVEMGGIYLEINRVGAIKTPSDTASFDIPADRKLPGLTVNKFKLTRQVLPSPAQPPTIDLTSVTVASVPTNVTVRIGSLPPFFTRVGELSHAQVSPDCAASIQAFLAEAPVDNGFYVVPLVLHSDLIARLSVKLEIEYVVESPVLAPGVGEPVLPFDVSGLPGTQNELLKIDVPANARIASRGIRGRVTGTFEDTRILHPRVVLRPGLASVPGFPLVPVKESGPSVSVSKDSSLAQPIEVEEPVLASAVDLLLAVRLRGALQLDLREDADGKPGSASLLPGPVRFEPPAPGGGPPPEAPAASWLSVPLPTEFKFQSVSEGTRYWLVLQSLEGEADWRVEAEADPPAPGAAGAPPNPGLQRTQDGALSWREAVPAAVSGPFGGVFRLRGRTKRFRMPIEMRVGTPDQKEKPERVSLERFAPSGRVDFTLDFEELSAAANAYLEKQAPKSPSEGEHLANGNFERWLAIGDTVVGLPVTIDLPLTAPAALAISPDGSRAYVVGASSSAGPTAPISGRFEVIDLVCGKVLEEKALTLGLPPGGFVVSPDGTRAYLAAGSQIRVIDLSTGIPFAGSFSLGDANDLDIFALAISPDGRLLYASEASSDHGSFRVLDTAALASFVASGHPPDDEVTIATHHLETAERTMLAIAPDGTELYVTLIPPGGLTPSKFHFFNVRDLPPVGSFIEVEEGSAQIAVTRDGRWALVANSAKNNLSVINLATKSLFTSIPTGTGPVNVAISASGNRAYVANQGGSVSVIDVAGRRDAQEPINLEHRRPVAIALTPEGGQLVVADAKGDSLLVFDVGVPYPFEWNIVAGKVGRRCLSETHLPVALLGSPDRDAKTSKRPESVPAAISQVVPVVASGAYEIGFRAIATAGGADAEVIWRGAECQALAAERIPIEVLATPEKLVALHDRRAADATADAALRTERPLLVAHRKRLVAPAEARQAEIRFGVGAGVVAAIAEASFAGSSDVVANADFSLREDNGLAGWALLPAAAPAATLLAADAGICVQNAGSDAVELVQTVPVQPGFFFTLEFEGRVLRLPAKAVPRLALRWLRDGAPAGEATVVEIASEGLATTAANGRAPEATEAEIRLSVPAGAVQEIGRISLRFTEAVPVTLGFVSHAPGELALTGLRVAFDKAAPAPPRPPDDGLCPPAPSIGGECKKHSADADDSQAFCPSCQREERLAGVAWMVTGAGRAAFVGVCPACGARVPRFEGTVTPGAPPFTLRREAAARPLVIAASIQRRPLNRTEAERRLAHAAVLMKIPGIKQKRAARLMAAGIDTPGKLATTPEAKIVELLAPGLSSEQAKQIIEGARNLASPDPLPPVV